MTGSNKRGASRPAVPPADVRYLPADWYDVDGVGNRRVTPAGAELAGAAGRLVYRFQARDLHLVLGPGPDGRPVRFRVRIDGQPPGSSHGVDVAQDGTGQVTEQRLYQLIRQPGDIAQRTFSIEFLDPGVSAYAFTFG